MLFQAGALVIRNAAQGGSGRGRRGLTPSQYNVLRILRGAHPRALTCGEISERLVTPGPDVTRLLDRLKERQWVERDRDAGDRRVVRSRITELGLELLSSLDEPVGQWLKDGLGHMSSDEQRQLIELLERAREGLESPSSARRE